MVKLTGAITFRYVSFLPIPKTHLLSSCLWILYLSNRYRFTIFTPRPVISRSAALILLSTCITPNGYYISLKWENKKFWGCSFGLGSPEVVAVLPTKAVYHNHYPSGYADHPGKKVTACASYPRPMWTVIMMNGNWWSSQVIRKKTDLGDVAGLESAELPWPSAGGLRRIFLVVFARGSRQASNVASWWLSSCAVSLDANWEYYSRDTVSIKSNCCYW